MSYFIIRQMMKQNKRHGGGCLFFVFVAVIIIALLTSCYDNTVYQSREHVHGVEYVTISGEQKLLNSHFVIKEKRITKDSTHFVYVVSAGYSNWDYFTKDTFAIGDTLKIVKK